MKVDLSALCPAILLTCGAISPALAQQDLSGNWTVVNHEEWLERGKGPGMGEYQGLPITDQARQRAMNWHASAVNIPERQCVQSPLDYALQWSPFRIWKEVDPVTQEVIAWRTHREFQEADRYFWMDGRAHPPKTAPHTQQGFSTGKWEGDKLRVYSTHIKEGYLRRNGLPRSDRATMTEHYMRRDKYMTISVVIDDPVYLTEPLIRTIDYLLSTTQTVNAYPCEVVVEVLAVGEGYVPHYYPWKHPFLKEYAKLVNLPFETTQGGAEQMYPSFIEKK